MSIADQYGIKVPYGSRLKATGPSKSGKADKQIHEIFEKEDPAPAAAKKTAKPGVAAKKPVVEALKEKIEKIEKAPPKAKSKSASTKKGRPSTESKKEVLSLRLESDLIAKIKKRKDWEKIVLTVLSHEFDHPDA